MLLAQEPAQSIQQSENVYENHMHTSEAARKGIRFCPPSTCFSLDAGIEYSRKHCGGAGGTRGQRSFSFILSSGKSVYLLRVLANEWPGFTIERPLDTRFTNFSRIAFT